MLELIRARPNWLGALSVALVRPQGVPERRHSDDPWLPSEQPARPRRLTDDLAWLRDALEDPEPHGLHPVADGRAAAAWVPDESGVERLRRLRDRAILEAAGFLLYEDERSRG